MKFGGTSVGSVDSILKVKQIVEAEKEPVIVVVSALGGITDQLIRTAAMATQGNIAYETEFDCMVRRHEDMIQQVIPSGSKKRALGKKIHALLDELKDIYQGLYLLKDISSNMEDTVVSYGERLSSLIVGAVIEDAEVFDSRAFMKTERKHHKHLLDSELSEQLIRETFRELPKVSVVPGFISSDKNTGRVTNLGRGGSDYTAAVIAAMLDASILEIWTDVDGFMTADPKVISGAYAIDELSYVEAMELCNFGAKVVYPPTIYPAFHKSIPILVKNTFNPAAPGTVIRERLSDNTKPIKGHSPSLHSSLHF